MRRRVEISVEAPANAVRTTTPVDITPEVHNHVFSAAMYVRGGRRRPLRAAGTPYAC